MLDIKIQFQIIIHTYFSKENTISNLAKYETYYQVALGILVSSTKTKEVSSNIELQYALGSIYELLKDLEKEDDLNSIFDIELQKQSAMDALQHFANENIETIKSKELNIENSVNMINDNLFFNEQLLNLCKENLPFQIQKWENIINDEVANAIITSLQALEQE